MTIHATGIPDYIKSAVITEATCNVSCWEAVQDICMCSCGGINHGIMKHGGTQPTRMRNVKGTWYVFVKAMIGQNNTFNEALRLAEGASVGRAAEPRYQWIVQSATDHQIDGWQELERFRGQVYRKYRGPYIIWCRSDAPPSMQLSEHVQTAHKTGPLQNPGPRELALHMPATADVGADSAGKINSPEEPMEYIYLKPPHEYLPDKFTEWRPNQGEALEEAIMEFEETDTRFIAVAAPTGSGKSPMAMVLGQHFRELGPVAILTNTKALQDQYTDDFSPTLLDFRGKSNYECPLLEFIELDGSMPRPCSDVSKVLPQGDMLDDSRARVEQEFGFIEKNSSGKEICPVRAHGRCPYYQAKAASQSDHALYTTNYANYMGLLNNDRTFQPATTLILDEAHNLDDAVENYAELTLSTYNIKDLGGELPDWYDDEIETQRQPEWEEWVDMLRSYRDLAQQKFNDFDSRRRNLSDDERKTFRTLENIIRKFNLLLDVKGGYHATWAPQLRPHARKNRYNGQGSWKFRPFYPGQMASYLLYRGAERVVFFSATIERTQVEQFGIDSDSFRWIEMPSTFPIENSRIFSGRGIQYGKAFTYRNESTPDNIRLWVSHLDGLLTRMQVQGHRTLVIVPAGRHVDFIGQHSMHHQNMVLHKNELGRSKQDAIDEFYAKEGWAVLVGAFDIAEGHSFDGSVVEATIFPKLWSPPDFNDPLNILRTKKDPLHNERRKARWFAQAVGRGTRSETDINHILLMDSGQDHWLKNAKALLPTCVKERFSNIGK